MTDLDSMIAKAHGAAEATENEAQQIEARICRIPGADRLLPRRQYGSPVNTGDIAKNLTLRGLIARADPALASFLGVPTGEHRKQEESAVARQMQAQALQMETERLRQVNAASTRYREQMVQQGRNLTTGRRWGA